MRKFENPDGRPRTGKKAAQWRIPIEDWEWIDRNGGAKFFINLIKAFRSLDIEQAKSKKDK